MFFTTAARILAYLCIAFGIVSVIAGYGYATGAITPFTDPSVLNKAGSMIDNGLYAIAFGLIVGVLTDISRSVHKQSQDDEEE